ncbi:DUF6916 family protein [Roseateles sp. DXS20W]|uniref:DUF6916 family protein n=2 Tax=Pelomonas lactea TaxID=3299030 RepID=A0ABW7GE59_9BURK
MMNKRLFLKSTASALAAAAGAPAALAAARPGLGGMAGLADWQSHLGEVFDVDGHAVRLTSVDTHACGRPGEQFSVSFQGRLPDDLGDGLRRLTGGSGEPVVLYVARTAGGLRADFCRLRG